MNVEFLDPRTVQGEITAALDEIEGHLLGLVREGSQATARLDQVIDGLAALVGVLRPQFHRLQELFDGRDLTFDLTSTLRDVRTRALWLYRKCRLEILFFAKLRVERALRDRLYRQVVETYEELSGLDEAERTLQKLPEDDLAARLLDDEGKTLTLQTSG